MSLMVNELLCCVNENLQSENFGLENFGLKLFENPKGSLG
jgi:hypothetical protein